jgi:hypothetical protein
MAEYVRVLESIDTWIFNYSATTVYARYLDVHEINNTVCIVNITPRLNSKHKNLYISVFQPFRGRTTLNAPKKVCRTPRLTNNTKLSLIKPNLT